MGSNSDTATERNDMTSIVVDEALREKLRETAGEVALCDETGRTIGRFFPEAEYREHMRIVYGRARELFNVEDIEAARRDPVELTTSQVLEHLRRL